MILSDEALIETLTKRGYVVTHEKVNAVVVDVTPACCNFHVTGGHSGDRHGRDAANFVYKVDADDPRVDWIPAAVRRSSITGGECSTCLHSAPLHEVWCSTLQEPTDAKVTLACAQAMLKEVQEEKRGRTDSDKSIGLSASKVQETIELVRSDARTLRVEGKKCADAGGAEASAGYYSMAIGMRSAANAFVDALAEASPPATELFLSTADRLAIKALVDALPRCESSDVDFGGMSDCQQPASGHSEDCGAHFRLCDKHRADGPDFNPLPYAAPLRALLDRMRGWDMGPATDACGCYECASTYDRMTKVIVCSKCGNKRCPKATRHDSACTNSNEAGQHGSRYK